MTSPLLSEFDVFMPVKRCVDPDTQVTSRSAGGHDLATSAASALANTDLPAAHLMPEGFADRWSDSGERLTHLRNKLAIVDDVVDGWIAARLRTARLGTD